MNQTEVKPIRNIEELTFLKNSTLKSMAGYKYIAQICGGAGCVSCGCQAVKDALMKEIADRGLSDKVQVNVTGCIGTCALGPVMIVEPDGVFYTSIEAQDIPDIVDSHFTNGVLFGKKTYIDKKTGKHIPYIKDIDFFNKQEKIALRNCGKIDYSSIEQYIAYDGYLALARVLKEKNPDSVVGEMKKSGLRGRGGGGFPTGIKWEAGRKTPSDQKYIVCNADEGDPGAFMDRSLIEGDPHSIIEGMMIGGYAIGANQGFVYIRAEYPLAIERLYDAIDRARAYGLLGKNILGSGFDFDIQIRIGAGSFVCGEETALMHSIEGKRGEPSQKPPFPFEKGLYGKPTIINNVETFANVAPIILKGGDWFASYGTKDSKGTKVFALAGNIQNTGLVEVPIGVNLGEIVYDIGGGIPKGRKFKAAQTGGPSGGCITKENLNTAMDYDNLKKLGTIMGSGGLIIMDEDACMVDVARFFMEFVQEESCGKCTPCRLGTKRMLEILERITHGHGREGDIELLEELGNTIKDTAICGLGQTGPNPVLSTIRYFRNEYEEHIKHKYCRAGVCSDMFISPCQNACPAGINVPGYISLISAGRIRDAYNLIRQDNPFPAICGRVCTHPCESKCRRGQMDEPIAICDLKRYAADIALSSDEPYKDIVFPKKGKSIGIIGAGPSGLTCGYYLARLGYDVDVYEEAPVAGGVLAFGIPEYRLPKDVLAAEIRAIEQAGVKIHLNTSVNSEKIFNEIYDKHDAVYVATGTQFSRKIGVDGEELKGVHHGLDFLREVHLKKDVKIGDHVVVIGGGNTAIDTSRVARRLGAKEVTILYRREIEDMPADQREIREAMEEGINVQTLVAPLRFTGNGKLGQVECIKMELAEFDSGGRRKPVEIKGSEFQLNCDMAILAVSQYTDLPFIKKEAETVSKWGTFIINPDTFMTNIDGVFAGGDCVRGSDTVITAIADGKNTAKSIDIYLGGKGVLNIGETIDFPSASEETTIVEHERFPMKYLEADVRSHSFDEVALGFHKLNAIAESMRCLRCDRRA
ncbi:MAG: hydrogenase [Spirochaetes bacterium GWF1_51_8]|nr:MAG: hydrogenase [Spirochaetes bacterium GWF1_51_8]